MAKQVINVGTASNDGTGDSLKSGAQKINDNFTEVYNVLGGATGAPLSIVSGVLAGNGIVVSSKFGDVLVSANTASDIQAGIVKVGPGLSISETGVLSSEVYTLPTAAPNILGGIKVGFGLSINTQGVLSATASQYNLPVASISQLGGVKIGTGVEVVNGFLNALAHDIVPATAEDIGGIKVGSGLAIDETGLLSVVGGNAASNELVNGDFTATLDTEGVFTTPGPVNAYTALQISGDITSLLAEFNLEQGQATQLGGQLSQAGSTLGGLFGQLASLQGQPQTPEVIAQTGQVQGQIQYYQGIISNLESQLSILSDSLIQLSDQLDNAVLQMTFDPLAVSLTLDRGDLILAVGSEIKDTDGDSIVLKALETNSITAPLNFAFNNNDIIQVVTDAAGGTIAAQTNKVISLTTMNSSLEGFTWKFDEQGRLVFPDTSVQTGGSIALTDLKTLVASSTSFEDFQTRIAAL